MRLYSIQSTAAYEALLSGGVLRADGRRVWHDFRPQYRWLMAQMRRRLPDYGGRYPLWAWYSPVPDIEEPGHVPPGEEAVLLEVEIPEGEAERRVLLSDFDAWGWCALNYWYMGFDEADYERFVERARERAPSVRYEEMSSELQAEVRASWNQMFDLEACRGSIYSDASGEAPQPVQAVLEEIKLGEVVRVRHFKGAPDPILDY